MIRVRDYSITTKLTWMNMLVSGTALLLACAAFITCESVIVSHDMVRNLSVQSQIIGDNSVSALLFNDPRSADNTLAALRAAPNIISAWIYTAEGQPFAGYERDSKTLPPVLPPIPVGQREDHRFKDRRLGLVHSVTFHEKLTAYVYLQSDLDGLYERLETYGEISIGVLLPSLLAAFLVSWASRRVVATPIQRLSETARVVSRDKNYAVRATPTEGQDEISELIGNFNGMLAQIQQRDDTLQKTQEALIEERYLLLALMDNLPDIIYFKDRESRFTRISKSHAKRLGLSDPTRGAGKTDFDFFTLEHAEEAKRDEEEIIATGKTVVGKEEKETWQDGRQTWVSSTKMPMRDALGNIVGTFGVSRDITELKRAEFQILKLNDELETRVRERTAELEAANKELEAFSYSVSHDLRAPLRRIDGFSQMVIEETSDAALSDDAKRHISLIREGAREMGQLVDELLNLSRVGRKQLNVQVTGLSSLVKVVVAELERDNPSRIIEWLIQPLPFVDCDATLMKQVFVNLLSNAVKYSRPRPKAVIEVGSSGQDGKPVIFVRDNGVGFSMKYVDKLFGVFQRLHRSEDFEGTGVGLATVQRIIQKHGGRVWAEGVLDRGATFYFSVQGINHQG